MGEHSITPAVATTPAAGGGRHGRPGPRRGRAGAGLASALAALALLGAGSGTALGDDDAGRNAGEGDGGLCTVTGPLDALEPGFDEAMSCITSGGQRDDRGEAANTVHGAGTGALPTTEPSSAGPTTTAPSTTGTPTTTSSTRADEVVAVANTGSGVPSMDVPPPSGVTRTYSIG